MPRYSVFSMSRAIFKKEGKAKIHLYVNTFLLEFVHKENCRWNHPLSSALVTSE